MLKVRNFAIANVFYFVFGVGPSGLDDDDSADPAIAVWIQGYRCGTGAGAGCVVITLLAPVGAQLVQ